MSSNVSLGILEILAGGLMSGAFALGMKYARRWSWENIWLVYSVVGLLLLPALITILSVPSLAEVYASVSVQTLFTTALFGFGWGVANVLCGLAFPRIGIALSFAIVIGLSASLGSLVPLVVLAPAKLVHLSGLCVVAGVGLALLGIGLLGWARRQREIAQDQNSAASMRSTTRTGLILCVAAGLLAPMLNFSFAFGSRISTAALNHGASPQNAVNAIWLVALFGGFIGNAGYCAVLLAQKHSFGKFVVGGALSHWALAGSMGVLWTLGLFCYGWGANLLGDMKAIVGWPVFQAITIITSTFIGVASGEWKDAPSWFVRRSCLGVTLLIVAIVLISSGNNL